MHSLKCNFPLIGNIFIQIKSNDLYDFTKRQLKKYIICELDNNVEDNHNFVTIKAEDFDNLNFSDIDFSREIKFRNNRLHMIKNSVVQKIDYEYNFNGGINLDIKFKKKFFFYIKRILHSGYSVNHSSFYRTVLYPIFSLYSLKDNYSLIHGSLIKIDNKYIILTGLDGIGKSSLSNELTLKGAKILADNFVLFNGKNFIGLNMPIRLDLDGRTDENVIYSNNNLKEVLYDYVENNFVEVESVYFLSIGRELNVKKMNIRAVNQNWSLINNGATEVLGANIFNIPFLYQNIMLKDLECNNFNSYSLTIPKGKIKDGAEELICQLNI